MAQYGSGEQYVKEAAGYHNTDNPLQSTTAGHQTGTTTQTGAGGMHGGHEQAAGKVHDGGILHRSGSGSSSSSEDDGEGGRRKKKGVMENIKDKLPVGGDHGCADEHKPSTTTTATTPGGGYEGAEAGHEKKAGLMEKIKEKLPGGHQ